MESKSEAEFIAWKIRYIERKFTLPGMNFHEVKFRTVSESKKDVIDSENDYNRYDIVLAKRLTASKTIKRWWKKIAKTRPHYSVEEIKAMVEKKSIYDWPTFLYKLPGSFYPEFLPQTTKLTQELISFYL